MIASLAGSFVIASCLGCTAPPKDSELKLLNLGPVQPVGGVQAFQGGDKNIDRVFASSPETDFRLPLKIGNDFSPSNWSRPDEAARLAALARHDVEERRRVYEQLAEVEHDAVHQCVCGKIAKPALMKREFTFR